MQNILKSLRRQKCITQFELSEALNISQTSISKYERGIGQPDLDTIILMADFFEISVDELVRGLCAQKAESGKHKKQK